MSDDTAPLTDADLTLFDGTFAEVETLVTGEPHPEWVEDARYYGKRLLAAYRRVTAERDEAHRRIATLEAGMTRTNESICQSLGQVLGYSWCKDDLTNFPGATEEHGVCVGEHVAESLADEMAASYTKVVAERDEARAERDRANAYIVEHARLDAPILEEAKTEAQMPPEYATEDEMEASPCIVDGELRKGHGRHETYGGDPWHGDDFEKRVWECHCRRCGAFVPRPAEWKAWREKAEAKP